MFFEKSAVTDGGKAFEEGAYPSPIEGGWREKAKVVSSVWEAEFLQFLASVNLAGQVEFILFFQLDRGKIASTARN